MCASLQSSARLRFAPSLQEAFALKCSPIFTNTVMILQILFALILSFSSLKILVSFYNYFVELWYWNDAAMKV